MDECKGENPESIKQEEKGLTKGLVPCSKDRTMKLDQKNPVVFDVMREKFQKHFSHQVKVRSNIELQLEKNELRLQDLLNFGNELVNNIKGANEQQELLQSQSKKQRDEELQENLRKEGDDSLRRFDEITQKWMEMNNLKEPMAIYDDMQKQRENIANVLANKDELIEKCQNELKRINDKYYDDQSRISQDVCFLVERIDSQIELLKKSFKKNLYDLQDTIEIEKQEIHKASQEKWNTVYEHLAVNESKKMEIVKEKQIFYVQEIEKIRNKQEEITRSTRIRLEKDAEMLELEIRKTRANILMNSEKIDYNYQVLQKRNEENIIINNQQKRRVAKFNESIVLLKGKLATLKHNNKQTMERLTQDVHKLHSSINDLQKKSEHFRRNNKKKFSKVWSINFNEIKNLLTSIFEIDRILYEQQLARQWMKPDVDLEKLDYAKEKDSCHKTRKLTGSYRRRSSLINQDVDHGPSTNHQKQLHDILYKISDQAGFLVEEKLLEILKPYTDDEKCLVRIENIFAALHITDIKVVESLINFFEPYSWCPNCSSGLNAKSLKSLCTFERQPEDDFEDESKATEISDTSVKCTNHIFVMEPSLVLTSLNEFSSKQTQKKGKVSESRICHQDNDVDLLQFDKEFICKYWQQFSSCMPTDKQNIWKSVEHGLNHYLDVLKKRAQIDNECVFLQKQNSELKHLLQKL